MTARTERFFAQDHPPTRKSPKRAIHHHRMSRTSQRWIRASGYNRVVNTGNNPNCSVIVLWSIGMDWWKESL
jgi:hypothetical protein